MVHGNGNAKESELIQEALIYALHARFASIIFLSGSSLKNFMHGLDDYFINWMNYSLATTECFGLLKKLNSQHQMDW